MSMSLTLRLHSSIGRKPVSLLINSFVAKFLLAYVMSISIFSFVGILTIFGSGW